MTWFVFPGFGLIDLSVTWDPEWPQVLEAGWGLYMTLLVGVPFTVMAIRGRVYLQPAVAQLSIAGVALIGVFLLEVGAGESAADEEHA